MPWHVAKSGSCPASKPWACIKDSDGTVEGCHATKEDAEAQMAALYANEPGANMSTMTTTRQAAAAERKAAAQARAVGAVQQGYYRSAPSQLITVNAPCGQARSLHFPAQMRAVERERNGQPMVNLVGIASVTNTPYEMWDMFGPYDELIDHAAFDETLAADPDVAFLVNHRGLTMARTRTKPGQTSVDRTLGLSMVDEGLQADAWLNPKRQDVSDLVVAIDDGSIDQMSFAFMLDEGWWNDDFTTFKITKTNLDRGDVSAVNYGANPYTSIAARSREILDDIDHMPVGVARAAMARLAGREDLSPPITAPDENGMDLARVSAWLLQHS